MDKVLATYLEHNNISLLIDGVSVMIAWHNEIAARLILTSIHCVSHHFADGQSGESKPFIKNTFKPIMCKL